MNNKYLVLITGSYPYGSGESFIEAEIEIIKDSFKKIIIVSQSKDISILRKIPDNCSVYTVDSDLSLGFRNSLFLLNKYLFKSEFWSELFFFIVNKSLKFNISSIKDFLYVIKSGNSISEFIKQILVAEKLQNGKIIFYSYWFDKSAYAVSLLLKINKNYIGITRAHSFDIYLWRTLNNYQPLKSFILKKIDAIFFISEFGKKYFINSYQIKGRDLKKIKVNKLGIINKYDYKIMEQKNEVFFLVSCSNIIPLKQIELIIKTLSLIDDISIQWIHIGDNISNIIYKEEIINMANFFIGSKENIKFEFIGRLSNSELLEYYNEKTIDLFINTSTSEGLPVSIIEAMSFGIPAIAPAIGGIPEIVINNYNGFLFSSTAVDSEIANLIIECYNLSLEKTNKLRLNAYNTWKNDYNANVNYVQFANEIIAL